MRMLQRPFLMWFAVLVVGMIIVGCGGGTPAPATYSVSGTIADGDGEPVPDANVHLDGEEIRATTVTTDEHGRWQATGLKGRVTITPAHDDYEFDPESRTVTKTAHDVDFTAIFVGEPVPDPGPEPDPDPEPEPFDASGSILDEEGQPVADVTVRLTGDDIDEKTTTTDADGFWQADGLLGEVTVTPEHEDYEFDPESRTVTEEADDVDFTAIFVGEPDPDPDPEPFGAAGTITDEDGEYVAGITVRLTGDDIDEKTTTTDADGFWQADGLLGEVTVTPEHEDYEFDPESRTVTEEADDVDFTAIFVGDPDVTCPVDGPGDGTVESPYTIYDVHELQNMANDVSAHYILCSDIDASETSSWNGGLGFEPIGEHDPDDEDAVFSGSLDGRGHAILDLYINRPEMDEVGLFGRTGTGSRVINVRIEGGEIHGNDYVGALVGNSFSDIEDVENSASVSGDWAVGGLIGSQSETGMSGGNVRRVTNDGAVTGESAVGGIVGHVLGYWNELDELENFGDVTATDGYVGGIAGWVRDVNVRNAVNHGDVEGDYWVGGVVGSFEVMSNPNNRRSVGYVSNSGNVYGTGSNVGGIVGRVQSRSLTVFDAYNTGDVTGDWSVGGIVGQNGGEVRRIYNTGDVRSTRAEGSLGYAGGIAGLNYNLVEQSFNLGAVEGIRNGIGGIVGVNGVSGFSAYVKNSYNLGSVKGNDNVGGAVGDNQDNWESGDGSLKGIVEHVYSAGPVEATGGNPNVGGLIGYAGPRSEVIRSYWDVETSGQSFDESQDDVEKFGAGKSTEEMMQRATYERWSLTFWTFNEGVDYPELDGLERPYSPLP